MLWAFYSLWPVGFTNHRDCEEVDGALVTLDNSSLTKLFSYTTCHENSDWMDSDHYPVLVQVRLEESFLSTPAFPIFGPLVFCSNK